MLMKKIIKSTLGIKDHNIIEWNPEPTWYPLVKLLVFQESEFRILKGFLNPGGGGGRLDPGIHSQNQCLMMRRLCSIF